MIDAALDRIAQEIHLADGTLSWQDQLRQCARMTWDLCEAHEGFAMTLLTSPYPQTHIASYLRAMAAQLETAGLTAELACGPWILLETRWCRCIWPWGTIAMRSLRGCVPLARGSRRSAESGANFPPMVWEVPSTYEDAVGQKNEIIIRGAGDTRCLARMMLC